MDGGDVDSGEETERIEWVEGAIIVGAGPAGLAAAACLEREKIPYLLLERSGGIAPLWRSGTYDRLSLHTPATHCALPYEPFPRESKASFPTRQQFLLYLQEYAEAYVRPERPAFRHEVVAAQYENSSTEEGGRWIVKAISNANSMRIMAARWLVVAAGENAEPKWPETIPGLSRFPGLLMHSSAYKNARIFGGMKVLVVGAGNSGMEIALDLSAHSSVASTSIVVRSPVHILPREMFGMSTFAIGMALCKIFPVRFVDKILVTYSHMKFGNTFQYGLKRPKIGPLELKNKMGKTPILDVGAFNKIQNGKIKVKSGIDSINGFEVRFVDNTVDTYDAIILATGYKSTIPTWLKDEDNFFTEKGLRRWTNQSQNQNGKKGLYACGLSGKGLIGASADALYIAQDIKKTYFSQNAH